MPDYVDLFILGLALLATGTISFTLGGVDLARRWGASPYAIALVAAALGSSAAGLAFNVSAVAHGWSRLVVGNHVGTNVASVGLILGLAALVRPLTGSARLISAAIPCLLFATLLFWFLCRDNTLSRVDAGILLAAFLAVWVYLSRIASREPEPIRAEFTRWMPSGGPAWGSIVLLVAGLAGMIAGAELAARAASVIPAALPHSTSMAKLPARVLPLKLGMLAAIGTSLPALVVAVLAARRGMGNVVLGFVIGASLSNLLLVAGITAMVAPVGVRDAALMNEIPAMALFMLLLVTPLANGLRVSRWEGAILLAGFSGFVAWQVWG